MALMRAKRARSPHYIYSKKRASLSIFVSTVLLVTTVSPASLALNANNASVAIPALCDPSALPLPISPSPAVSISPTPQPEVSATPENVPIPNPSEGVEPVTEPITQDYVAPIIPAGESSATVSKSEPATTPKVVCPSPVTNVVVRPLNTQLEVSWSPGISAEPNTTQNITDFYVKVLETAQVIKVSADKTSTVISGLTNGNSYSIIVYAASEYGSSMASDLATAIPLSGNEGEVAGIIVAFKPEANVEQGQVNVPGEELVSQVELTIENKITEDVHVVEFSEATTLEEAKTIASEISQDPQVVWAEPDQFVYTAAQEVINDPNYSTDQWNLWDRFGIGIGQSNTEMTSAWSLTAGQGVNVAVIDTGITSHPDLDSQVIPGFDFVSDPEFLKASREENGPQVSFDGDYINSEKYGSLGWDDNPQDPGDWRGVGPVRNSTWHGTHIAGVIAAQSENQEGIAGIAPGAKIQPIRALSWRGGLLSDIASSITWASGGSVTGVTDNPTPAKVINMSFSVNSICPTSLQTAINDAFARGSVLVAAAGNNNDDVKNYAPANCENVISVGASNKDGKRAAYSNYGLGIDVSAPGGDANDNGIYSTSNPGLTEPASFGYASQQGTSISAAHVSAIAARIFSSNPTFNPTEIKAEIVKKESVRQFADTQCDINADIYCGEGIVSLFQVAAACSPTQTTSGGYIIQTFTSTTPCEWTPSAGITKIDALLVAGGGGGGSRHGGGGGAGGVLWAQNFAVSNSQLSVSVGSGGIGAGRLGSGVSAGSSGSGTSGANTTLKLTSNSSNGLTASGGGGGGGVGLAGGSGGGSNYDLSAVGSTNQSSQTQRSLTGTTLVAGSNADGTTITNYGNNGGLGIAEVPSNYCQRDWCGGGGGGAGAVGGNATISGFGKTSSNGLPGNGGVGIVNPISGSTIGQLVSASYFLAGGGGGASSDDGLRGTGGNGGGGAGGNNLTAATSGTASTGGGGGGGGFLGPNLDYNTINNLENQPGGNGGTGVLIIRYLTPPTIASATISGSLAIGQTLTATANTVTGTSVTTTHQWQSATSSGGTYTDISGATNPTYVLTSSEAGKFIKVVITVTNTGGNASRTSNATAEVLAAPTIESATISGTQKIGNTLTATAGSTTGTITTTSYKWQFSNDGSTSWTDISGATSSNYIISDTTYRGKYLRAAITVTNLSGTATAYSSATSQIYYADCSPTTSSYVSNGETYNVRKFLATGSCDWSVPANVTNVRALIVGGGGGGGAWVGGGGGGGGFRDISSIPVTAGSSVTVTVGSGGAGAQSQGSSTYISTGANGGDSTFGSYTSAGGGRGGSHPPGGSPNTIYPTSGGSGGGGTGEFANYGWSAWRVGGAGNTPSTTPSQGNNGGNGLFNQSGWAAGGGGGAGGVGGNAYVSSAYFGGPGGIGATSDITGTSTYYAGGGGGALYTYGSPYSNSGGLGGGGAAGSNGTAGTANTGGGGGGGSQNSSTGGSGGSGIVIVSFIPSPTIASATISGTVTSGQTLTATANSVTGSPATTSYQWQSAATSGGSYSNIAGATSSTYVLTSSEETKFIKVVITVTNSAGSASATSSATVAVALAAPTIASASITGINLVGETLTATANTVTGTSVTTTYQWQSCASSCTTLSNFSNISGATSSTYVLTSSEASKLIRVIITVTNSGGNASATSSATTVILNSCSSTITTPTINGVARTVRQITTTGTCYWVPPSNVTRIDLLVIGGGGGAGSRGAGGGGAGGFVEANSYSVTPGSSYEIVVGTGGAGAPSNTWNSGTAGVASSFKLSGTGITANGGGAGLNHDTTGNGGNAGSGSGSGGTAFNFNGGSGARLGTCGTSDWCGGGGGGAGSLGSNAGATGGNGGSGRASSITGASTTYAGGGGGGGGSSGTSTTPSAGGSGGSGGGGNGGSPTYSDANGCRVSDGSNGTDGLGGGGGGGSYCDTTGQGNGGSGGAGIVIVSYVSNAPTVSAISPTTGSVTAGATVTITGTNFVSGQTTASINGVSLTSVSVSSSTTMTAVLPTLTVGTFNLVVDNGVGSATLSSAFSVLAAPTIASATISGTTTEGQTLTATANTVTGTSVTATYQWQSATTSGGSYSNISGATSSTYVLTSSEATKFLKVIITVTNSGGSASATSSATAAVARAAPTIGSATISGSAFVGQTLTAAANTVTGTAVTTTYQWQSAATSGGVYSNISSATSSTYIPTASDLTSFIRVVITVTNTGGTADATSSATTAIVYTTCSPSTSSYVSGGITYNVRRFLTAGSCEWATPSGISRVNLLIVGGGGGGGSAYTNGSSGGGGGGQVKSETNYSISGNIVIGVGSGGILGAASDGGNDGGTGGTSTFGSLSALGGGGGNKAGVGIDGLGGAAATSIAASVGGRSGGFVGVLNNVGNGGGGGGSLGVGANATSSSPGAGGSGTPSSITGSSVTYGSGGSGGIGGSSPGNRNATNNTGNGGLGSGARNLINGDFHGGGTGGSGIVVVAYANLPTVSAISPTSGAIGENVSVTITGTNFIAGSTVTIGGVSLSSVSVVSNTSITGTISAGGLTAGTKDVVVTASGASTGGTGRYEAISKSTPSLSAFSDTSALFSESTKSLSAPTVSVAGTFAYSSSNTAVASFASSSTPTATLNGVGTSTITATFTPSDPDLYNSTTTTLTLTVSKGNQSTLTVSSTSGTFGSGLTLATSGGTDNGAVTYAVSRGTASSCTESGGVLTAGSAGTCLVTATKAATTNYNAISSVQTTVTFAKASQSSLTISTTSGTFGTALSLSTSGGSGDGAVTYVATTGTATSCSISGTTLTAGSGGTCLVTATKAASTNFNAISSSQTTITFAKRSVVLSNFTDISNKTYGDSTFTLTAPTVAGSVAGSFAYTSGTTATATISGSTVTIIGAGTSTITATFTPTDTASYENQTITMLLTVNKKAITVTAEDKTKVFGQSTPANSFTNSTLVASDAISSLTFTYSGTNTTTAPTSVGNYTITPSSATFSPGSANNYIITYVPSAYSITKATPTFSGFNNVSKTFRDTSFTITAPTVTGSVAGTFAYSSSDTSAITISSATATVAGSGSSLITATFTPTDTTNYNSATITMTISVAKATQSSLSINSASSVNYGSTLALTSTGGSGTGAVSFAVTSGTCSISSTTLTPGDAGSTCVIQVTKAADSNYNIATSSTQTITVNKINQTVSFTSTAPSSPVSGDTYRPLATSSSGAIPTISIDATSSSICSISAGIVTFNTSGPCLIEADSASSTNYNAASTASQSITVAKIAQTITFTEPTDSNFGDSNRTMNATASSGLAITYSRGASTTNTACNVSSEGIVEILAVGNCQVTASQGGNDQYAAASAVSTTFAVSAIVPSAPFLTSVSAGDASATVSFTAPTSTGGATISAYEVVAIPSTGINIVKSTCSASASPLACTLSGPSHALTNGVSYTFKVAAINSAGTSAYSTTSGSFTPATSAGAVTNLVAQPGNNTLIVDWDQLASLGGGTFVRYDVYYKASTSGTWIAWTPTVDVPLTVEAVTALTITGLANGTSYDVRVVVVTRVGTGAEERTIFGDPAQVSQYPSTVPSAPTSVTVSKLTGTSARISWGLPLTDGGAALDATTPYVATITGGPSPITCGALSGRSCDITGLTPATTYSVSIVAQNRMGAGTAGTATYLVPSNDANLLSFNLKTGPNLSSLSNTNFAPTFNSNTTSYSVSVANTDFYTSITPTVNELTATIKINGVTVTSGVARNLSLGIGSNVFTVEVTAGDLITTKTYTLTVTRPKASQMPISITSASSVFYGNTITLTTTGGSGSGLVSFTTTGTCTTAFSGGNHILTPGDVGSSCSIVATKATDDDYFSASTSSQTITINKTTPTLSGFSNISKTYGDPTFTINDPSVAGSVPGTFTYVSSNTSVASISGSTVTVAGFGTSTITATFVPSSTTNYNSTTTSLVISVAKKSLRVTPGDKTKFFGASHPTITKSVIGLAGSEEIDTISYTYEGTGSTSFAASTSNPVNAGTYSLTPVITALTSGSLSNYDITYDAATFTINKVSQSGLTIVSSSSATFGETLTLSTSGGSGTGSVSFTKVSGDCTLNSSGSTFSITPGDAGNNCVVNATKAADTNYEAITTTDQTITIGKATQTLTFTSTPSSSKVNDTYTPVVTSKHSSTAVSTAITPSITIDPASSSVCTISGGVITFDAAGSCVINADANSSTNYEVATTTSQTITVTVVISNSNSNSSSNSSSNSRAISTPVPTPSAGVRPNAQRPVVRNVVETPPNRPINPPGLITPPGLTNLPPVNNPELRPIFPSRSESVLPNSSNPGLAITDNIGRLPKSDPGEKQISVGGNFLPIQEFITPEGNMGFAIPETTNVAPVEVVLKTTDIEGQNIPASDDGILRAVKGQTITVSGEGLTPGSTYSAWLFSKPTKLGEGKVGADSKFEKVFLVPESLATGEHTLQINGINSDKKVVSLTTGVILTDVRIIQNVRESDARLVAWAIIFIFILLFIIGFLLKYIRRLQTRELF